jgi:hypothetical protein
MRKVAIGVTILFVSVVACVAIYMTAFTYTYRYRLAIDLDVDGQNRSGSSVIEVTRRLEPVPGRPWNHYSTSARGDAVFVDLGSGRNLVVLLIDEPGRSPETLAAKAFHFDPSELADKGDQERRIRELTARRAKADLRDDQLPTLITFAKLDDPQTARAVSPRELPSVFGPRVRYLRAWVEMTDDPAIPDINRHLPWWDKPLPWLTPIFGGVYVDERPPNMFRINKVNFRREG